MRKRLTKMGNSHGIIIDKPILDLLNVDVTTELAVSTDGTNIYLKPIRYLDTKTAMKTGRKVMNEHAETLRRLAASEKLDRRGGKRRR